ncbi:MAG: protocatechuate 3,4-dioxygenase subunit alpha [Paracoccaceae bacterium]
MSQKLHPLSELPSQTAGPYVHIGCIPTFAGLGGVYPQDLGLRAIENGAKGAKITIRGSVFDGTAARVRDAMLESWQADAAGLFADQPGADPMVNGFCRFAADGETGEFTMNTVKPGPVRHLDGYQAPHIALWIVARGINTGLQTRIYFDDEDNSADPVLARVQPQARIETLIAKKTGQGEYRFDIRLQGDAETVFLDI